MTLLTGFCKKKKTVLSKTKIVKFCHKVKCEYLSFQIRKLEKKIKKHKAYERAEEIGGEKC